MVKVGASLVFALVVEVLVEEGAEAGVFSVFEPVVVVISHQEVVA